MNAARQDQVSVSQPPASGPRKMVMPQVAAWMPNTRGTCALVNSSRTRA